MSRDDRPPAIEKGPRGRAPFSGLGGREEETRGWRSKKKKERKREMRGGDEKNCTRVVFSLGQDLD